MSVTVKSIRTKNKNKTNNESIKTLRALVNDEVYLTCRKLTAMRKRL